MPDDPTESELLDQVTAEATEGASDAEPSSQQQSDDSGSIASRYQSAGLDLESLDPAEMAQAHAFYSRVKGKQVFTEDELPERLQGLLSRLSQSPQGQEYIRRFVPQQPASQQPAGQSFDADDPYAAKFQELERQIREFGGTIAQQNQALQELNVARQSIEQERQAKQVADELEGYLQEAVEGVAGARGMRHLTNDFWRDIRAQMLQDHQLTKPGVKAWVKSYVAERSDGGPTPRKATPSGGTRGGSGELREQDLDKISLDDVTKTFMRRVGLQ